MRVALLLLLVSVILVLVPDRARAFELEGYAGFYRYDGSLAEEFEADNSPIFGLRFGSGARQILSGETTIAYGPADDIRILLLMGNFLINIPVDPVIPYVTIGTGTTIYLPKDVENATGLILDSTTNFTLNYGGGFRYFVSPLLALRFDIRDYVTFDLDFDVAEADPDNPINAVSVGTIHNTEIAGGLSLVF